jgi:CHAT domain-containing protein
LLTIVPYGVLHYLPFTALWSAPAQAYLGETYLLNFLPSASVLRFVKDKAKDKPNQDRLLAIANPVAEGFATLSHAADEVTAVAALYDTTPFLPPNARKSTLFENALDHDIIFLAAHGELNSTSPLFSRIILSADESGTDDGSLTVEEVYNLNLSQANLVVLSACQTSLGELSRGDDFIGLNRAFIYAGTPSILASLWSVDDEATRILISSFFRNLKAGSTHAEALRRAQAEVRSHPDYVHPFYWSAFVLTGE